MSELFPWPPDKDWMRKKTDVARERNRPIVAAPVDGGLHVSLHRTRFTKKGVLTKPMKFHCAPLDEFGWETTFNWTDYDTVNGDQYTRRGGRALRTVNLNGLTMDWQPPWAVQRTGRRERPGRKKDPYGAGTHPERVARRLDKLVMQGTPMMLVVRNPRLYKWPDWKRHVTLRSARLTEKAGEPDSRYFELSFVEYRVPEIHRRRYGSAHELPATVKVNQQGVAIEMYREHEKLGEGAKHTIGKPGRPATLRMLAKHYYGSPKKWYLIVQRNGMMRPDADIWSLKGDAPLTKLFAKRKRKRQPIWLYIPEADWRAPGGGITPKPKKPNKRRRGR